MRRTLCLALITIMLTACVPAPAVTATPELAAVPTPTATLLPAPSPILEVQMPWQVPDERYDNSPWWQGTPCFYGEPLMELIPATDYGLLYPYVGGMTQRELFGHEPLLGLCTANGQIITAPIYGSYFRFTDGINTANLLHNTAGEKSATGDQPCTLYATDGSWALEFESVLLHEISSIMTDGHYFVDVGFLAVKKNGFWGTVGYDGQILEPFVHETPERLYHADFEDEDGHRWSWFGDEVFVESWYDDEYKLNCVTHIGQTKLEGYHSLLVRDVVYVYHWDEEDENRRTLCYDHEGNFLSEEPADLYWDLAESIDRWVPSSTDETTGAITTYTEYTDNHDGAPLITVRPIIFSVD